MKNDKASAQKLSEVAHPDIPTPYLTDHATDLTTASSLLSPRGPTRVRCPPLLSVQPPLLTVQPMHCPERLPARSAKSTQVRGSLDDGLARLTNVTKILDRKLNDTDAAAAQIKLDVSKTREAVGAVGEGLEAAKARLKTAERDIEALKLGLEGAADREVPTPSHRFPALLASWQDPLRVAQQHGTPSIANPP